MTRFLGVPLLALVLGLAPAAGAREALTLAPRPGVTETVYVSAAPAPRASLILFTGGSGGYQGMGNNFLVRVAESLVARGFTVALPELPSDQPRGMSGGFRAGAEHAQDIAAVVVLLRQRAAVPVWLVGTSRGTISAAAAAARLGPGQVGGLVLTSTVWPDVMRLVALDRVAVPTLLLHNRDDGCQESPPSAAEAGLAALAKAPAKQLAWVSGGASRSGPCQALSPHGYYGVEDRAVAAIADWIAAH
jgi:pimeloyl-ACP methyl ester carboxylesterase